MLKITASHKPGDSGLEAEVDEALSHYNEWYSRIQTTGSTANDPRVPVGLSGVEYAAIKTFVAYYLGVGGYYTPPDQEDA